ncbi:glycosyltransferase [Thermococcus sp. GR4]|uniref:glycosyltransferase n=1 Tax=Thermococcus sp. GR4 TaxID=1638254 RepID=UPI00142F85B9|nr:glycosyltransferase [Thermococcus sp. GR4]
MEKNTLPLVSVIIPTYNSEKTIKKCIEAVKNQTYPNIEVIVVDGGSTDRTVEIAKSLGTKVIISDIPNRSRQINIGVMNSLGKYIYRLDSDIIISPRLIAECVQKCEKEGCDAVSTYWGPDPSISFWAKVRKLEKDCYKYDPLRNAANFYKKEVFLEIGGYDENLVAGEDYDIQNRLLKKGYKHCFAESEGIHLGEPKSIIDIARKNYKYGKTTISFLRKTKQEGFKQVNPIRMSLLKNWKKFLTHPVLTLGFFVYYLTVYLFHFMGVLSGILHLRTSEKRVKDGIR